MLRKEKERPIHRITTSLKRSQNSSWAEQQQRWVDVEKLIQLDGLAWSRAATVPRTGLAILDQPQTCRTDRNRMGFPSHFPANLILEAELSVNPKSASGSSLLKPSSGTVRHIHFQVAQKYSYNQGDQPAADDKCLHPCSLSSLINTIKPV